MAQTDTEDFKRKRYPWARLAIELEALVAALGCWLVGVLLGMLFAPLFWIGFTAAIICLLAGRRAGRTPPEDADAVVSPVDGVVQKIDAAAPPAELRLGAGPMTRVRIASSPATTNILYAPASGGLEAVVAEEGDPSRVVADDPDAIGLAEAFVSIATPDGALGFRAATGGLGPRIDLEAEPAASVRVGRRVGKRRLGGWCDVFLPPRFEVGVLPGMTVVGGETPLGAWISARGRSAVIESASGAETDADDADWEVKADADPADKDLADMFSKLRREVEKADEEKS